MTAIIHTAAVIETDEGDVLSPGSVLTGLDDFLRDPIGYGEYDFAHPLSLDEFSTCRHMHGFYAAALG